MAMNIDIDKLRRKAEQHYEMAGLARQDGDKRDAERHLALAKKFDELVKQILEESSK